MLFALASAVTVFACSYALLFCESLLWKVFESDPSEELANDELKDQ